MKKKTDVIGIKIYLFLLMHTCRNRVILVKVNMISYSD